MDRDKHFTQGLLMPEVFIKDLNCFYYFVVHNEPVEHRVVICQNFYFLRYLFKKLF